MTPTPTPRTRIKRKNIRFKPEAAQVAFLQFNTKASSTFKPEVSALILEESAGGCGLVVIGSEDDYYTTQLCRVKVGKLAPLRAEIRWLQTQGRDVISMGLKYLE